jgi:uncharacterized OB-fold protein
MSEKMTDSQQQINRRNETDEAPYLWSFIQQAAFKTVQLGQLTLDLYAQGQLTHAKIAPLCDELLAMEKELKSITAGPGKSSHADTSIPISNALPITETAAAPTPAAPVESTCPRCQAVVAPGKKFCTACGLRLIPPDSSTTPPSATNKPQPESTFQSPATSMHTQGAAPFITPPPAETAPATPSSSGVDKCSTCGVDLVPNAAFCTNCGQSLGKVKSPSPDFNATDTMQTEPTPSVIAGPITKYCQNCGKGLTAEATACSECGGVGFDPA